MYVLADIEWVTNSKGFICPTQLSAIKADEDWNMQSIKLRILECCTLFAFEYEGKEYHVDPFSETDFHIYADGDEFDLSDIKDVMNMPYIDGKSLNEAADYIKILDW